jgi:hypothetical protein
MRKGRNNDICELQISKYRPSSESSLNFTERKIYDPQPPLEFLLLPIERYKRYLLPFTSATFYILPKQALKAGFHSNHTNDKVNRIHLKQEKLNVV